MKTFLAVFLGAPGAMDDWKKLPEDERKKREQTGIAAWHKWAEDNKAVIGDGSPLGKTKRVDKSGLSDVRNELGAWTVVKANSQEEAAKIFLDHPHFTVFPGDRVEVMECLPIPQMR